jgi:hypothetical protein
VWPTTCCCSLYAVHAWQPQPRHGQLQLADAAMPWPIAPACLPASAFSLFPPSRSFLAEFLCTCPDHRPDRCQGGRRAARLHEKGARGSSDPQLMLLLLTGRSLHSDFPQQPRGPAGPRGSMCIAIVLFLCVMIAVFHHCGARPCMQCSAMQLCNAAALHAAARC